MSRGSGTGGGLGCLFADSQNIMIRCSADQGSSATLKEPNTTGMLRDISEVVCAKAYSIT